MMPQPAERQKRSGQSDSSLAGGELQMIAEERQYVILKPKGHVADVRAGIDFEAVGDAVAVKNVVKLSRIEAQTILIADIDRDRPVLLEVADILIDERQRRVGSPSREHVGLNDTILGRQVEKKRRLLRIGRPSRRRRQHRLGQE